jgi:hypothetical protein
MSLGSTLNASQGLTASQKPAKAEANFFAKLDSLGSELKEVAERLHELEEEAAVPFA